MSLGRIFRSMMGFSPLSVTTEPPNFRGIPTAACPNCGGEWFKVPMTFDLETYDVAAWGMDGECYGCGALLTVCCPADARERELP